MAGDCTRRDFLVRISAAHAAFLLGCHRSTRADWLARERVCVHVFDGQVPIPKPLLEDAGPAPKRGDITYFSFGLPELTVCSTRETFLQMFQYFWPVTRDEIEHLRQSVEIKFQRAMITGADDLQEFGTFLRSRKNDAQTRGVTSAVLLTYNDYTRFWTPAVIRTAQETNVDEVVLFKNPAEPPYLCDYPAAQKKFKKPPR